MGMNITDRVGVSTHFMPATYGEDIYRAMELASKAGFKTFELVPAKYQIQVGFPYHIPNVGLWIREMSNAERSKLKKAMKKHFKLCTIHAQHVELNIASYNPGIREESIRQYIECIELADDLEIKIVTFHCGGDKRGEYRRPKDVVVDYNCQFMEKAIKLAEKYDINLGWEFDDIAESAIEKIDHKRFGINLDIGHAVMFGYDPTEVAQRYKDKLVEVHFNSVNHYHNGFKEHDPVICNNACDYQSIFTKLKEIRYKGPIICEIQGNDIPQYLHNCKLAKKLITGIWTGKIKLKTNWYYQ